MSKPILLVEDETIVRESLKDWLTDEGYEVVTAEDGEKALEIIGKQEFGIVVLDLKLPGKDGIQVLKEARGQIPTLKAVIITAYPSVETAVEATKAGAIDYLVKPFAPESLEQLIKEALEAKPIVAPETAIETKEEELSKREVEIATHLYLGQDFFKKGDYGAAIKEFKKVVEIAPGNLEARVWIQKAKTQAPKPAVEEGVILEEAKPKYCVWMVMRMVSYRLCTHDYECLTCEFDQQMQEKMVSGEAPEIEEALARFKELPGNQRLCRYALKGDVSYRLCPRLFYCNTCEFAQMMDDNLQQKIAQRLAELAVRQQALRKKEQCWWWSYWSEGADERQLTATRR